MSTTDNVTARQPEAARTRAVRGVYSTRRRQEAIQGVLFILPWVIGFLAFTAYPMMASLYYSFTNYKILGSARWVGLRNYIYAFSGTPFHGGGDPLFWLSMARTITWVVFIVPLGIAGSLLAAVLLNSKVKAIPIYRMCFFLPSLTPAVAAALLWSWILQPDIGVLNSVLHSVLGIKGPNWLYSLTWSMPAMMMIALWSGVGGGQMLIFLAGLQSIPAELYDAAKADGANRWQRMLNVTIPLITPTILFNLILGIISSFQVFALAFVTTGGGPAYATYFYALHLYIQSFRSFAMGYGSALAWILFAIVLSLTAIQIKLSNRWVYYESLR